MDSMDVIEVLDVTVRVPGSCGELLQGWHRGEPFLVTCPIARYTTVRAAASLQGLIGLGEKARCALQLYLREADIEKFPFGMQLTSELPRGKGMASSSADIAAVLAAASQALGQPLAPEAILHLAVQVEPTDAVFLPGIVCLNQVTGRVQRVYRRLSHPYLTIFDTGGTVDTADCHACAAIAGERGSRPWTDLLEAVAEGERRMAEAATQSALWNQARLPKHCLEALLQQARDIGALGLVAAHSGTVIGVIWPSQMARGQIECRSAHLARQFPNLTCLGISLMCSGGVEYMRKDDA